MSRNVDFRSKPYQQLSQAIGELALVWNDLHMVLSDMFHAAIKVPNGMATDALWNTVRSDRTQRDMIKSLIELEALGYELKKGLRDEVLWALKQVTMLEDLRNNAIHSPVFLERDGSVSAWHELGNPRAKNLVNKNLLKEFRWFYDTAIVLRQHIEKLTDIIRRPNESIPERPQLPKR